MSMNERRLVRKKSSRESSIQTSVQSWSIWSVAALFYLYELVLRAAPSVMTQELMSAFHITSTQLGVLVSFYYYSYTLLQVPCGLILDKLGARRLITFSSLLCTVGTYIFATTDVLSIAQLARFMVGAGSACAFISCLKLTVGWFSPTQFALVAGLTNMMGGLGGTFAGHPMAVLVNRVGFKNALILMTFLGILVTFFSWTFIKDPSKDELYEEEHVALKESLWLVLKQKQIWISGIIGGLMYLPITAFAELWAVPFLMSTYSINNEKASFTSVMVFIGMAIGSPVAAWFCGYLKSHKNVMSLSAILTGLCFFVISCAQYISYSTTIVFSFLAGFFMGGQVLCFTVSRYSASAKVSGTTAAFTNTLVMACGIFFQPFLGMILDFFWTGKLTPAGIRFYDATCYRYAIMSVPICLILSFVLSALLKETYQKETIS